MPSPAEELAAQKSDGRLPTTKVVTWVCKVREARRALKLTLAEVAPEVGLSLGYLAQVESGTEVRLQVARRIADFFGKKIDELWPEFAAAAADGKHTDERPEA